MDEEEEMDLDEEEDEDFEDDESEYSSALLVEKKDLQSLSIPFDDDNRIKVSSSSSETVIGRKSYPPPFQEPAIPSTSQGIRSRACSLNPEDDIRKATAQYLQGELTLTEFAVAMEDFERYKEQEDEPSQTHPSLILLNPETIDVKPLIPEVSMTEETTDDETKVDTEGTLAKLKGEFFRTGDDTTTFTIRRKKKMPPTIKNMMGEAHLRYARGDLEGAESICLEVIKEQPTYKDPFHTLAMIYESQGRVKKSLQFFLICALLDPKHFEDWPRLADLSADDGNAQQAIMCLNKAVIVDPLNIKIQMRRSELMAEVGDNKGALRGYHKVLQLSDQEGATYMDVSKKIAAIHFQASEVEQAYEALSGAFNRFGDNVTTVELNLLVEVCISLKRYVKAITLFMRFSGVRFEPSVAKNNFKERNLLMDAFNESNRKCIVPIGLHADLVQKLAIVLIHLEAFVMVQPILDGLKSSETIDGFGLSFYEIAEAYIAKQQYQSALDILTVLINSDKFSMAEIWLRYAECLFLLNRVEDSAEAYSKVIKLAPGHKIARLNLSVILQRLGKYDVALESLDQNEMEDLIDQDLLVEKCNILLSRNRIPEFFEAALQLFSRHCPEIRNHDEAHALVVTSQTNQQLEALRALRSKRGEPLEDDVLRFEDKQNENPAGEWTVYLNLLRVLLKMNRPDLFSRVAYTVWASNLFSADPKMKKDLDLHCLYASIFNADLELTPYHLRTVYGRYSVSPVILNLMSLACRRCGHTRYGRIVVRLLMKNPNDTRLMMLSAHNSFMNGTYKYALMEYFALLKVRPNDPLIHLMIASTLLHIASQKSASNRSQLMVHAMAFMTKYSNIRGECQEVYYNMGRFYHYLGLFRQALMYYKRALLSSPLADESYEDHNISDLKRESAFSIAQIYKASNCWELARKYIHRYIIV